MTTTHDEMTTAETAEMRGRRERYEYPPPTVDEITAARTRIGREEWTSAVKAELDDLLTTLALHARLDDTSPFLIGALAKLMDEFGEHGVTETLQTIARARRAHDRRVLTAQPPLLAPMPEPVDPSFEGWTGS